ncbi:type II secretion system protein N [Massilia sp. R2A-15]|uniref:type II secretion system protein N n=1 Tax=Massilia sp. R2A-15 TaxID=3064278 RepID=UPI00273375D2|nr:type II secretion system protein N [Massilia sp. R2A-15]WLI89275.1 type II secretion system protein N [Massilia sp. R2A-15]
MKRLPLLLSFLALIVLSASIAYWVLQLYQPAQRPLAAAPAPAMPPPGIDAAASLFGGQASAAVASNYQLTGVVAAGRDSVAIIVADNGPPQALKLGKQVAAGITVQEVHPRYVMLSDGGVLKRIDLPAETKSAAAGGAPPAPNQQQVQPQPQPQPQAAPNNGGPQFNPNPAMMAPPSMTGAPQPAPPPPAPVQMPPPVRQATPGGAPTQLQ